MLVTFAAEKQIINVLKLFGLTKGHLKVKKVSHEKVIIAGFDVNFLNLPNGAKGFRCR